MKPPWNQHETSMKPAWNQHETTMKPPWNHHETTIFLWFSWFSYGFPKLVIFPDWTASRRSCRWWTASTPPRRFTASRGIAWHGVELRSWEGTTVKPWEKYGTSMGKPWENGDLTEKMVIYSRKKTRDVLFSNRKIKDVRLHGFHFWFIAD